MSTKTLTAEFEFAKETPGTFKLNEVHEDTVAPISGTMYFKKYALANLEGYEGRIRVTVEAV